MIKTILIGAVALVILPFGANAIGFSLGTATDLVVLAVACMGLNLLLGKTGLVSFGHGAWFGSGAYIAALSQKFWFPQQMLAPFLITIIFIAVAGAVIGALLLRRRGVYFSLLTLAVTVLAFSIAYRSTNFTGGENGLGDVFRGALVGISLEPASAYYIFVALVSFAIFLFLVCLDNSPFGAVLEAIRENETRAEFIGFNVRRYKLIAFVISVTITGFAGALQVFHHRFASADPLSVSFSGALVAMVVIGGMRSFLGPALGAAFYSIMQELLTSRTDNWLFWFGLVFVATVLFSPNGLMGFWSRIVSRWRTGPETGAAMAERREDPDAPVPQPFNRMETGINVLEVDKLGVSFGALAAVKDMSLRVSPNVVDALIGPNGAGKTTLFNLISGFYKPTTGSVRLGGRPIHKLARHSIVQAGLARSFQITSLFPVLTVYDHIRLAVVARSRHRYGLLQPLSTMDDIASETRDMLGFIGLNGIETARAVDLSYGGQRILDLGLALATRPNMLLLDEPFAGLAVAERDRVSRMIGRMRESVSILMVEHDLDRVLKISDAITVMEQGTLLASGSPDEIRKNPAVQKAYIGDGAHHVGEERQALPTGDMILSVSGLKVQYGKSVIINDFSLDVRSGEIVALVGRNGAGKSTILKSLIGLKPPSGGDISFHGENTAARKADEIARLGMAYVPQGRALVTGMSVAHNIELGRLRRRTGNGTHWDQDAIFELFPRIRERSQQSAELLSGGEQQMVAVARALTGDTRLLLLDEPFEGLSPLMVDELVNALDKVRRSTGMIVVDHNLDVLLNLADRVVVLEQGRIIHEGPARPLLVDLDLRKEKLWL